MKTSISSPKLIFAILTLIITTAKAQLDVASTGKVGIGTSNPQRQLVVSAGNPGVETHPFSGYGQIIAYNRGTSLYIPLVLQDAAGGNVGIGTTSPGYKLHLGTDSGAKPTTSTWTVPSDSRTKTNVNPYNIGLAKIRQVKLVSYEYNGVAGTPNGEEGVGVIAQDFQSLFPNCVKSFNYKNDSLSINEAYLGVNFHELFISNVRAVQELDSIVSVLDSIVELQTIVINDLQNQVATCCDRSSFINTSTNTTNSTSNLNSNNISGAGNLAATLDQNIPNPFNQQTSIGYYVPEGSKSASIMVFDLNGKLMTTLAVNSFGKGSVTIGRNQLSPGMFVYSLIVDGKIIDTKRMILTN